MTLRIGMLALAACLATILAGCSSVEVTPVESSAASTTDSETSASTAAPNAEATLTAVPAGAAPLALRAEVFEDGGAIPDRYTCIGANDSPALSWSGVPEAARALALIVYDRDAGAALGAGNDLGFLHWMVYDIPPTAVGLPLAATGDSGLLAGAIESANDFSAAAGATFPSGAVIRGKGYDGPCPPAQHTYVFRLIALNEPLGLPAGTPYQTVMSTLEGRVLAVADWTGVYPPAK